MAANIASVIQAFDSLSFALELLALDVEDRADALADADITNAMLFARKLRTQMHEFEAGLPKFKRPKPQRYTGPRRPGEPPVGNVEDVCPKPMEPCANGKPKRKGRGS
jgi:hypothetical protein